MELSVKDMTGEQRAALMLKSKETKRSVEELQTLAVRGQLLERREELLRQIDGVIDGAEDAPQAAEPADEDDPDDDGRGGLRQKIADRIKALGKSSRDDGSAMFRENASDREPTQDAGGAPEYETAMMRR